MGVVKEWLCAGHGFFEADEPICPKAGCTTVERAFLTPAGYVGARTRSIDQSFQRIAKDYGLSDMNNRDGKAARVVDVPQGEARAQQEQYGEMLKRRFGAKSLVQTKNGMGAWGGVGPGGVYRAGGGIVEGGRGPGAPAATAAIGAPRENVLSEVAPALTKPRVKVTRDPDNLRVPAL